MNKMLTVLCPREEGKRYFSYKDHGYSNKLNIFVNDESVFENINDAEEKLPIFLEKEINFDIEQCELKFSYNIEFEKYGEEKVDVIFLFKDGKCYTHIDRKNYVDQSDQLDDYEVTFEVNDHIEKFGKEYHIGDTKEIKFEHEMSIANPIKIRWWSRKSFLGGSLVTYDDIIVELRDI